MRIRTFLKRKIYIIFFALLFVSFAGQDVYAGTGTNGSPCDDKIDNGHVCGSYNDDRDCAPGYWCNYEPEHGPPWEAGGNTGYCRDSGGICPIPECVDTVGCALCPGIEGCFQNEFGSYECMIIEGNCGAPFEPDPCREAGETCGSGVGNCCADAGQCSREAGETDFTCGSSVDNGTCLPNGAQCYDAAGDNVIGSCCSGVCNGESGTDAFCDMSYQDKLISRVSSYDGAIVDLESLITNVYRIMMPAAIAFFGIPAIAMGGYKIMTSQGDPGKTKEGKEDLTAGVVGTAFLLGALNILAYILKNFLGQ